MSKSPIDSQAEQDQNLRARMAHLEDRIEDLAGNNQLFRRALSHVPEPTRRQVMTAAAATVGVSAGGAGFLAGQETAAASNHNDSVGDVGLPGDRVDVFAESVDAGTVDSSTYQLDGSDLDVADLSGASGSNGEVPQTDGTDVVWSPVGGSVEASQTDDGSDITHYRFSGSTDDADLVNVSGAGVLLGGIVRAGDNDAMDNEYVRFTVDGGTTYGMALFNDDVDAGVYAGALPSIVFDSSLVVNLGSLGAAFNWSGSAWVKQ